MEREALKLALEALDAYDYGTARIIIHEALAQSEITTGNILMDSYKAMQSMKVEGKRHVVCQCDKCKAQPVQEPMFKVDVAKRKWESLQADGHEMEHIAFAKGASTGIIDAWGKVIWLETTPPLPVQPANLHNRLADLHLYEEIAEHYAKCAISPEALRDWVAERVNIPPLPIQRIWVSLTDDEKISFSTSLDYKEDHEVFAAIEAKLKELNL